MKATNFKTQKILLSGLLVAVLGSQYYYSFSSIQLGAIELSSRSPEAVNEEIREVNRFMSSLPENGSPEQIKARELLKLRLKVLDAERKTSSTSPISEMSKEDLRKKLEDADKQIAVLKKGTSVDDRRQLAIITDLKKQMETQLAVIQSRQAGRSADAATVAVQPRARANPVVAQPDNETGDAPAAKTTTEGKTVTIFCNECSSGGVTVTGTDSEIARIAKALSNQKTVAASSTTVADVASTSTKPETAAERREREREEREARREEAEAKRREIRERKEEKARLAREKNNWDFEDKVEAIVDRCGEDFECKAERFAQLTRDFRGNKKVDPFVVNKAYNDLIDKDLKAMLRGEDGTAGKSQAYAILERLIGGIPSEYRNLKTKTVDSLKHAQISQATAINGLYRQADTFAKQNKPQESVTTFAQAQRDEYLFRQDLNYSTQALYAGLDSNRDGSVYEYVRNQYLPDMNKILLQMNNLSGINLGSTTTQSASTTLNNGSTTTTNGRGGRTGQTAIGAGSVNSPASTGLGGVQFNRLQTNPSGTRTGINPRQ